MSSHEKDVYGPGFNKAKRLAMARSGGKCQFCGLRKASEGHHWAWDYPSDEEIQGHDLTALCNTCHELATMLRDWVQREHANFDEIEKEIEASSNFYQKREAFSYWLFPEEDKKYGRSFFHSTHSTSKKEAVPQNLPRSNNAGMKEEWSLHPRFWFCFWVFIAPLFLFILIYASYFLGR